MSKKRPITFNKPDDPSFLKKIKASIGYKEGPSVETKRQNLDTYNYSDEEEDEPQTDYKPQVVVLRAGDLTEEEAEREKQRLLREEQEKPADLSQRVVFKKPSKEKPAVGEENEVGEDSKDKSKDTNDKKDRKDRDKGKSPVGNKKPTAKLSFAQEDDEGEEDF